MRVLIAAIVVLVLAQPALAQRGTPGISALQEEDSLDLCDRTLFSTIPESADLDPHRHTACGSNTTMTADCWYRPEYLELICKVKIRLDDGSVWVNPGNFHLAGPVPPESRMHRAWSGVMGATMEPHNGIPFSFLIKEGDHNARTATILFDDVPLFTEVARIAYWDPTTGEELYILIRPLMNGFQRNDLE